LAHKGQCRSSEAEKRIAIKSNKETKETTIKIHTQKMTKQGKVSTTANTKAKQLLRRNHIGRPKYAPNLKE
jgi:hypothetical protein